MNTACNSIHAQELGSRWCQDARQIISYRPKDPGGNVSRAVLLG